MFAITSIIAACLITQGTCSWLSSDSSPEVLTKRAAIPTLTMADVAAHNSTTSRYIVLFGMVYDITTYANTPIESGHPGGQGYLSLYGGSDATKQFTDAGHPPTVSDALKAGTISTVEPRVKLVGALSGSNTSPTTSPVAVAAQAPGTVPVAVVTVTQSVTTTQPAAQGPATVIVTHTRPIVTTWVTKMVSSVTVVTTTIAVTMTTTPSSAATASAT